MGYAFISYSTKNQASADAIRTLFNKNKIGTWMAPNDIPVGSTYPQVITQTLKECSCLVLLLSNDAQNSVWVSKEVERAINYKKPIFPVQLEDVILNDTFELYISTNQIIAIHKIDEKSEAVQKLLTSICACLGQPFASLSKKDLSSNCESINIPSTAPLSIGEIIDGKYQVVKQLSHTDNSGLYITANVKNLQQFLVKAISKNTNSFDASATVAEFSLLRGLAHPGLPALVDFVDSADMLLVVYQYCDGNFLQDVIRQKNIPSEDKLIDWAIQLCSILTYLHPSAPANSFLNLCPGNILLKPDNQILLLDFLFHQNQENASISRKNTLDSLFYLAPEVLKEGSEIDKRADIYSLGATLYSLATGNDPALPPHAVYPLRQRNPELSAGLEYIITKCMESDSDKRYDNAQALLQDLKNIDKLTKKLSQQTIIQKFFKSKK